MASEEITEAEYYMALPYAINVVPEQCTDGSLCYRAYHPELPGCMSHSATPEQAIENLTEAKQLYIETLLEKGLSVPKPQGALTSTSYQAAILRIVVIPFDAEEQESTGKEFPEEAPFPSWHPSQAFSRAKARVLTPLP